MITTIGSDSTSVASVAAMPKVPVAVDTKGRLRVSKTQRRDILAALARSGESVPGFARRTGIKYSTLARWVQLNRSKGTGGKRPLRLLEAVVESPQATKSGALLVLQLPGGARLELADATQAALAARLLRELAKPC